MSSIATIGFFDGVHRGHQFVLCRLLAEAQRCGMTPLVVTFREHPLRVLRPDKAPALLSDFEERLNLIRANGIENIEVLDFSEVQPLTAAAFMQLLHRHYDVSRLLMGYDHRFGCDRLTDAAAYIAAGKEANIEVSFLEAANLQQLAVSSQQSARVETVNEPSPSTFNFQLSTSLGGGAGEAVVSSTKIRKLIQEGSIEQANYLLGHPYMLCGKVVEGNMIGRRLGFPTANLDVFRSGKVIPANGVYEVTVSDISNQISAISDFERSNLTAKRSNSETVFRGVMNIGNNPTVGNHDCTCEVHLLDFTGDLYGKTLSVALVRRIREERHFDSLDSLRQQIAEDVASLRS